MDSTAAGASRSAVVVVGSINMDIVVPVPHLPAPGETVLGGDHFRNPGGKGANQAVAAARLGQRVAMVGRVGDDDAGAQLMAALRSEGVDTRAVTVSGSAPTGIANIAVDPSGENSIVVSPGANARVATQDVEAASDVLDAADVVLLQLEIPVETVLAAARVARGVVVLNPAPAQPLPAELLSSVDVLVPNAGELAALAGRERHTTHEAIAGLARALKGPRSVIVTLGAEGALVVAGERATHVPAMPVDAVDTTAAGDAFCGALADAFVRGGGLEDAARWAVRVAGLTVTKSGAQASLPSRAQAEDPRA